MKKLRLLALVASIIIGIMMFGTSSFPRHAHADSAQAPIISTLLTSAGNIPTFISQSTGTGTPATHAQADASAASDCEANHNLGDVADNFISRCRRASIRREFPSQLLSLTLREIKGGKSATYHRAWKLLNDNRFRK